MFFEKACDPPFRLLGATTQSLGFKRSVPVGLISNVEVVGWTVRGSSTEVL